MLVPTTIRIRILIPTIIRIRILIPTTIRILVRILADGSTTVRNCYRGSRISVIFAGESASRAAPVVGVRGNDGVWSPRVTWGIIVVLRVSHLPFVRGVKWTSHGRGAEVGV